MFLIHGTLSVSVTPKIKCPYKMSVTIFLKPPMGVGYLGTGHVGLSSWSQTFFSKRRAIEQWIFLLPNDFTNRIPPQRENVPAHNNDTCSFSKLKFHIKYHVIAFYSSHCWKSSWFCHICRCVKAKHGHGESIICQWMILWDLLFYFPWEASKNHALNTKMRIIVWIYVVGFAVHQFRWAWNECMRNVWGIMQYIYENM